MYILSLVKFQGEGWPLLKGKSIDLSSKLSLTSEDNVNHYKSFIRPIFLRVMEQGTPRQILEQISKLIFQRSVQVLSLFGQAKGGRKVFF